MTEPTDRVAHSRLRWTRKYEGRHYLTHLTRESRSSMVFKKPLKKVKGIKIDLTNNLVDICLKRPKSFELVGGLCEILY